MRIKKIKGTDYSVSDQGLVISKKSGAYKTLKPLPSRYGYSQACLLINGKSSWRYIHRIVASAFIENKESKPFVNHIDGNRTNNHYSNLEWCTQKENIHHSINVLKNFQYGENNPGSKLKEEDVKKIRDLYKSGLRKKDIGLLFPGIHRITIHDAIERRTWKHLDD